MAKTDIKILGRLVSGTSDKILALASEIFDVLENKRQSEINAELKSKNKTLEEKIKEIEQSQSFPTIIGNESLDAITEESVTDEISIYRFKNEDTTTNPPHLKRHGFIFIQKTEQKFGKYFIGYKQDDTNDYANIIFCCEEYLGSGEWGNSAMNIPERIVQNTGDSSRAVMSQYAVTEALKSAGLPVVKIDSWAEEGGEFFLSVTRSEIRDAVASSVDESYVGPIVLKLFVNDTIVYYHYASIDYIQDSGASGNKAIMIYGPIQVKSDGETVLRNSYDKIYSEISISFRGDIDAIDNSDNWTEIPNIDSSVVNEILKNRICFGVVDNENNGISVPSGVYGFIFVNAPGTYTRFGNLTVKAGELAIFYNTLYYADTGWKWKKETLASFVDNIILENIDYIDMSGDYAKISSDLWTDFFDDTLMVYMGFEGTRHLTIKKSEKSVSFLVSCQTTGTAPIISFSNCLIQRLNDGSICFGGNALDPSVETYGTMMYARPEDTTSNLKFFPLPVTSIDGGNA